MHLYSLLGQSRQRDRMLEGERPGAVPLVDIVVILGSRRAASLGERVGLTSRTEAPSIQAWSCRVPLSPPLTVTLIFMLIDFSDPPAVASV